MCDDEYTFDGERWWKVDDVFTQETVWEQLRFMSWLAFATLMVVGTIIGIAL